MEVTMKKQILMLTLLTGLVGNSVQAFPGKEILTNIIQDHPKAATCIALAVAVPTIGFVNKVRGWLFGKVEETHQLVFGEEYKQFGVGVISGMVATVAILNQLNKLKQ